MPVIFVTNTRGVSVVDRKGNVLCEINVEAESRLRLYGLAVDPKTGNIFVGDYEEIFEFRRTGRIIWRYRNPKMKDLHSITLTPQSNLLLACAQTDRILEVNKKEGVVWEWWAGNHYPLVNPPEGKDWTHLNYALRLPNGDTLISLYRDPNPKIEHGLLLRIDREGKVVWEWGRRMLIAPHCVVPYGEGYLVADTNNRRLLYFEEGWVKPEVIKEVVSVHTVEVLPNGNLLLAIPAPQGLILEITPTGEEEWRYEIESKGLFTAHYLPEWSVEYTDEERREIRERLKAMGYL